MEPNSQEYEGGIILIGFILVMLLSFGTGIFLTRSFVNPMKASFAQRYFVGTSGGGLAGALFGRSSASSYLESAFSGDMGWQGAFMLFSVGAFILVWIFNLLASEGKTLVR